MGNGKYPIANEWHTFIQKYNGYSNAKTETIHTTYSAEIPIKIKSNIFIEMLQRFAYNFISPLFKLDLCETELNKIENEFKNILCNHCARKRAVTCRQCHCKHPIYNFGLSLYFVCVSLCVYLRACILATKKICFFIFYFSRSIK